MQLTESIFLETYKRFEALCDDLFSCRHGVSAYIVEMERTPDIWQRKVPGWKDDFYTLKHLRWLRNQLVHNPSAPGCTDEDVRKLQTFHARILNRQERGRDASSFRAGKASFAYHCSLSLERGAAERDA